MAAILFLLAFILAAIHWGGGTLLGHHYLDAFFTLLAAGLFLMAMGWGAIPVAFSVRRPPPG